MKINNVAKNYLVRPPPELPRELPLLPLLRELPPDDEPDDRLLDELPLRTLPDEPDERLLDELPLRTLPLGAGLLERDGVEYVEDRSVELPLLLFGVAVEEREELPLRVDCLEVPYSLPLRGAVVVEVAEPLRVSFRG